MLKDGMAMKGIAVVALAVAIIAALDCCQRKDGGSGPSNSPAKKAAGMSQEEKQQKQPNKEGNTGNLTGKAAEAIAIKEVVRRTKLEARQLEADSESKGKVWGVVVCEVPPKPGAFWYVYVRHDGTIKEFTGGE